MNLSLSLFDYASVAFLGIAVGIGWAVYREDGIDLTRGALFFFIEAVTFATWPRMVLWALRRLECAVPSAKTPRAAEVETSKTMNNSTSTTRSEELSRSRSLVDSAIRGDPIGGEVIPDTLRAIMAIVRAAAAKSGDDSRELSLLAPILTTIRTSIREQQEWSTRVAAEHDAAIIRHNDHARWRMLYLMRKEQNGGRK